MKTSLLMVMVASLYFVVPAGAAERHMMQPVVPTDKLAEARALKNPLSNTPEVIENGKLLYNGKGGCVTCHVTGVQTCALPILRTVSCCTTARAGASPVME